MRDAGMKVREIALALGVSTQAVYKHLKAIEREDAAASAAEAAS
jgi:predicted ArsR family transcriptional regulator